MGVFVRMTEGLAATGAEPKTLMIDATYLKAHRTASSLRVEKGDLRRLIGRTKGGMNTMALLSLAKGFMLLPMRTIARSVSS